MDRKELLKSPEYWIAKIQIELFDQIRDYMVKQSINQTQLAGRLGVTKGYITQILNGDFDHRISKMVELSLAIGKVPEIDWKDLETVIQEDVANTKSVTFQVSTRLPVVDVCFPVFVSPIYQNTVSTLFQNAINSNPHERIA